MLKEIIIPLTEQYHNIGHINPIVDKIIDGASGRGHRLAYGHDMEGMIEAYHIDGIEGIGGWFDHMLKDFTSPDGIPLPFARAIEELTGMNTTDTIDWLCVNAADAIELGGEVAAIQLFKNNPAMYKASVIIGTTIGIVDDNPLLIAYNTILVLKGLKGTGRLDYLFTSAGNYMGKCWTVIARISVGVAFADIGMALVGINIAEGVDTAFAIAERVAGVSELADWADIGAAGADIIDGVATLGLGILASRGVKALFNSFNKDKLDNLKRSQDNFLWKRTLQGVLVAKSSPTKIMPILDMTLKNGVYTAKL